jgi:putative membrane protein
MLQIGLLGITCLLLVASLWQPIYPHEQLLQHVPTVVAIVLLAVAVRRRWLSTSAFVCLVLFLWLHILGARHIYSYVPYDDWFQRAFGFSPTRHFGWQRNHYDRFVHVCFGALAVPPTCEVAQRFGGLGRYWAIVFAVAFTATLSSAYEIAEWIVAIVLSPESAEAYNGQQGDMWDAQKDMALAAGASLVAAILMMVPTHRRPRATPWQP